MVVLLAGKVPSGRLAATNTVGGISVGLGQMATTPHQDAQGAGCYRSRAVACCSCSDAGILQPLGRGCVIGDLLINLGWEISRLRALTCSR